MAKNAVSGKAANVNWLKSHRDLIHSDYFTEDAWRATQSGWKQAYWDTRRCLRFRREYRNLHEKPYNRDIVTGMLAMFIILAAIMFAIICIAALMEVGLNDHREEFIIIYLTASVLATWITFRLYRHKIDFYWQLYSYRLHMYEKTWPGIITLAKEGSLKGVTKTPPALSRRDAFRRASI